ncbi:15-hydroxyprostaglandin dehydrogenase [NAD(+)]-like [Glandiceps talaboti]
MELVEKVAIVTGGAEGIGKAISERFLREGCKGVVILDNNDVRGKETERELSEKYGQGRTIFITCDVTSKSDLEDAFHKAKTHYQGLDIVCNNAAIQDEFKWESTVDINLNGVIRGTYIALQNMGTENGGNGGIVINTASVNGLITNSLSPIYGATKHGVVGFTRNVANESLFIKNKVRVAAICPGKVDTPLQQKVRCRYPEEFQKHNDMYDFVKMSHITDAVVLLITDCDNMNGAIVTVLPGEQPIRTIGPPDYKLNI